MGYQAVGIDGDSSSFSQEGKHQGFLQQGELTDLDALFSTREFDFVVASAVFSLPAQKNYLLEHHLKAPPVLTAAFFFDRKFREDFERTIPPWVARILKSSYRHLKPGGFFVACEYPIERLSFDEKIATGIGFVVEHYDSRSAVLQKPAVSALEAATT